MLYFEKKKMSWNKNVFHWNYKMVANTPEGNFNPLLREKWVCVLAVWYSSFILKWAAYTPTSQVIKTICTLCIWSCLWRKSNERCQFWVSIHKSWTVICWTIIRGAGIGVKNYKFTGLWERTNCENNTTQIKNFGNRRFRQLLTTCSNQYISKIVTC